ncbi:hypothetical protein ACFL0K_00270 [Patescibacteria group bacterium]
MTKLKQFFTATLAVAVLMPVLAFGATIEAGEEVFIKKGENIRDNVYAAGGNVSVSSAVFGDLLTAGGNILISENVSEDIAAAGGAITILGDSNGDVRVAGGNVLIAGDVAGDLIVAGGTVTVSSDVSIGKDLVLAGGQVLFDGNVAGDAQIAGGIVTLNGHIKGNVKADIDEKLTIGDSAVIDGTLEYGARSEEVLVISDNATITGEITFKEMERVNTEGVKNFVFAAVGAFVLFKLISFIVVALILVLLFRNFSNKVVEKAVRKPLKMLGKGFAVLVLVPVASAILFATLFGAPLALIALSIYGLLLILSSIYGGVVVGAWLAGLISKSDRVKITWQNVIGGMFLITVVKFIPLIGWIACLLVLLVTLGSISHIASKKMWGDR